MFCKLIKINSIVKNIISNQFNLINRSMSSQKISYLNQNDAINLDQDLFNECQFSVDQLMELAGLSVASVIKDCYPIDKLANNNVLICCGPGRENKIYVKHFLINFFLILITGNNGGDGLVAARHLQLFEYNPVVYYPKRGSSELFARLVSQLESFEIKIINDLSDLNYSIIVDSLFGFSFKPPVRPQFIEILNKISNAKTSKLVSVDIPSGWNVENGPPSKDDQTIILNPDCLISLTAPKKCAQYFQGEHHYLGGRFIPNKIAKKYNLQLPLYSSSKQFVKL